jgi:hypothetical protein
MWIAVELAKLETLLDAQAGEDRALLILETNLQVIAATTAANRWIAADR